MPGHGTGFISSCRTSTLSWRLPGFDIQVIGPPRLTFRRRGVVTSICRLDHHLLCSGRTEGRSVRLDRRRVPRVRADRASCRLQTADCKRRGTKESLEIIRPSLLRQLPQTLNLGFWPDDPGLRAPSPYRMIMCVDGLSFPAPIFEMVQYA